MVATVEKVEGGYAVRLTPAMMQALDVGEGSRVEVSSSPTIAPQAKAATFRYATADEFLRAFEDSREQYEDVYRELAK